ncbi:LysR family transcriptional regulator CrgA [Ralstonia mannitolilytica]|uniref:LysR family transcriptional regulator CrgA n=1 Tax=Ralstonia mannitolilytica TaxID=105219 RepID=UPI0005D86115|nr:LysR family transcriptional regulator CrgA [Ralstonia mannitolilytica]AJW43680.1 LysR family transcriptional regulator [Ralstonia mannitolilytica]QIF08918.1 LysR family transcriptional regulator [Ralstonia mannitolilytica]CAJ0728150.1 HTH-type transcriptional regulator DmlR [Ralstonia mannitolilytica]CAJ0785882.1 HTH-type transcriptional regulator DmlR [Ralstonia mannitolilytica]
MDKLRTMETFVAVVESGNFTEAAARLEMSAVMVGKYVSALETQLGARLLQRSTRRQSLTDAGRVFYEDAKRVLEQVRWAETSVERLRASPSGTLRVSAPTTFGACVIAPLAATFQQAHPQVRVELNLSNGMVDLVDEGFDLAIRIGPLGDADLVAKPLCVYRMVICASPEYLARYGRPETPADLPQHRCLSHMVWNNRNAWQLAGWSGATPWRDDPAFTCNDGHGLRAAAVAGAGLLLQPEVLVAEDLASGRLVRVLQAYAPEPRPIHVVYRQDRRPLPKLSGFVGHLLEQVPKFVPASGAQ